jgi:hypothetical protein
MDAPDRQLDMSALQRVAPGEDVLVDAVDECAVKVKDERGGAA